MPATSASRSRSLVVAAATLTAWTQGCMTYQSSHHAALAPNAWVRVRDSVPFHVLPLSQTDGSLGVACRMTLLEGSVSHTRDDTTYLSPITRMVPASAGDRACVFPRGTMLALPGAQLRARTISEKRVSASLTLGYFALFITGAALAYGGLISAACSGQRDC